MYLLEEYLHLWKKTPTPTHLKGLSYVKFGKDKEVENLLKQFMPADGMAIQEAMPSTVMSCI